MERIFPFRGREREITSSSCEGRGRPLHLGRLLVLWKGEGSLGPHCWKVAGSFAGLRNSPMIKSRREGGEGRPLPRRDKSSKRRIRGSVDPREQREKGGVEQPLRRRRKKESALRIQRGGGGGTK